MGVTYYAQGHDVLVEAGFHSYEKTSYRYWTMSPEAHNVPVVVGKPFRGVRPLRWSTPRSRATGSRTNSPTRPTA